MRGCHSSSLKGGILEEWVMEDTGAGNTTKGSMREGLIIRDKEHITAELKEARMIQAVKEGPILEQNGGIATSTGEDSDKT